MQRNISAGVRTGNPIEFPGGTLTPRTFAIVLRMGQAAWVWNTPVALKIVRNAGEKTRVQSETVRIVNVTRWAVWGIALLTLLAGARLTNKSQSLSNEWRQPDA